CRDQAAGWALVAGEQLQQVLLPLPAGGGLAFSPAGLSAGDVGDRHGPQPTAAACSSRPCRTAWPGSARCSPTGPGNWKPSAAGTPTPISGSSLTSSPSPPGGKKLPPRGSPVPRSGTPGRAGTETGQRPLPAACGAEPASGVVSRYLTS